MSVQKDSNDSIFYFHLVWRRSVFFSHFYKLTSCPFFITSSPISIDRFFFFIYSISSVHTHLFMFSPFFVCLRLISHVFVLMYCVWCLSFTMYVWVCKVYVCLCLIVFFFIPSFFFLWVLLRLDKKGWLKFPLLLKCICVL